MLRCLYIHLVLGRGLTASVLSLNASSEHSIPALTDVIKINCPGGQWAVEMFLFSSRKTFPLAREPTVATVPPSIGHEFSALNASGLEI